MWKNVDELTNYTPIDYLKDMAEKYDFKVIETKEEKLRDWYYLKSEKKSMILEIWNKRAPNNQKAYFAILFNEETKLTLGLPYYEDRDGSCKQHQYRLNHIFLKEDIGRMIEEMNNYNSDCSFPITIKEWHYDRGYGFAYTRTVPKIFIHISQLPENSKNSRDLENRVFLAKSMSPNKKGLSIGNVIKEIDPTYYTTQSKSTNLDLSSIKIGYQNAFGYPTIVLDEIKRYNTRECEIKSFYKENNNMYEIHVVFQDEKESNYYVSIKSPNQIINVSRFRDTGNPWNPQIHSILEGTIDQKSINDIVLVLKEYKNRFEEMDSKGTIPVQVNRGF